MSAEARIAALEKENEELLRKLRLAKRVLIKLDAQVKNHKKAASQPCPVCGFKAVDQKKQRAVEGRAPFVNKEKNTDRCVSRGKGLKKGGRGYATVTSFATSSSSRNSHSSQET